MVLISGYIGDHYIEVNMPLGNAGSSYNVVIDNHYHGAIVHSSAGWIPYFLQHVPSFLTSDDILAIMDAVYATHKQVFEPQLFDLMSRYVYKG